ncbi:hypothetical protein PR048_024209 [Dryococelus australis]|uniref:Transposase n=1 Tax=Dryococelus australis TaxID=614101 RepID=A0ABQ9GWA9_9NEOP|nr:hypothetical protein PR048_024209 [Dryococelus australis]
MYQRCLLLAFLEDVSLVTRDHMWIKHNGAPPHNACGVREYLDQVFPGRWIGLLAPPTCHLYLWGHMESLVYEAQVDMAVSIVAVS